MTPHIRFLAALALLSTGLTATIASEPAATAAAGQTCATVSPTLVHAALGVKVQAASEATSSNSFYGYKESVLSCTYAPTVNISFSTPATTADFRLAFKTLKNVAGAKMVSGIGSGAFYGKGSNSVCTTTCKSVTTDNLWVLVTGKSLFEISASKVTFTQEETLAKKIVRLV